MINQSAVVRAFRRLGSTGILLLALSAGTLGSQAVSTAQGLQVGSPWPTFHQNNLHTGVGGGSGAPGTLKWDFEGQQMSGSSPAIAADGTIYIGGVENALFAIKPANGRPKWTFNPGYGVSSSPAIGADGTIYIGAGDTAVGGAICAVNPADGSLKWKTTTSSIEYSSPAIGTDGTIYVGGSGGVYALNPADGSQKWFFPSQYATYPVESSPAIGPDGTIYVGADDSNVYAINPVDGSQKWKFTTGGEVLSSPAIGADGTIYVGSEDNNVYALNPVNGSEKWEFVTGNEVVSSPAIGADGTVYVGSDDNNVYALNPADGSQKWMFTTGDQVCSSPAIGADGTIYISSCDSNLYAIDPADGSEEWHYTFPSPVYTSIGLLISSPAIGADGTLYLGSTGFDFCAIGRPVVSVVVTSSSNPAAPGQPVTLTATVSPVAPAMGMPTGTVTFMDGLGGVGTEALSNGVATLTPGLSAGSHSITASYSGDSNFPAYTSAVLTQVVLSAPLSGANVALTSSPNPSLPGQSVTLTATVSPVAPATGTPTGTVTFLDGTTTLETQALTNGVATFPTSTLTAGSHSITASYSGDNSFGAALSAPVTQVVIGPPSVSLTSSLNPSQPGLAVTFNVTVATVAPARGTPTGTVTFIDGTTTLGTQTLTNGVAALSTSTLTPGDHSITASYSGDTNFTAATSGALVQVVEGAVLTLSSSANPSVSGQSVTITVTASAVPITAGTPTGTVTFLDGTTILGTQALSNGQAAFSNSTLTAGTHSISASYSGDSTFAATRSMALTQIVTGIAIALTSSADPSLSGQSVTFTAAVSPVPAGTGTPTGTVTFLDGTTTLGTQTIGNGSTAFTASILSPGTHLITASYSGDSNYGPTSGTLIQQVGSAGIPWTWGSNSDGQLGNNSTSDSSVPVPISSLTGVTAVAGGDDSTLALQIGGAVWAWGSNTGGKLGNGTENDCSVPSQVKDPTGSSYFTGAVAVAEGDSHSLALKSDGTVWAWGSNAYGQLGNNGTNDCTLPIQVKDPTGASYLTGMLAVAAGSGHSLALKSDGTVWAWGYNCYGQLGNNSTVKSPLPVQVEDPTGTSYLTGIIAVAAGSVYSLALRNDGTVWAWGYNAYGQLGNNGAANSSLPVQVKDPTATSYLTGITAIAAGLENNLALKSDGTVWAWGHNANGELGNNSTACARVPVQVNDSTGTSTLTGIAAVAEGGQHSLAMTSGGTAWSWGDNSSGQLGIGTAASGSILPVQVSRLKGALAVAAGDSHSIAIAPAPLAASVVLTSSQNPSVVGQSITFTAAVAAKLATLPPGQGGPTGTVTFLDGATTLGMQTLSNGKAVVTVSTLAIGSHPITAAYSGDSNFGAAASSALTQIVNIDKATVGLTSSPSPSHAGQSVTFAATVLPAAPGTGTPTGTVTFLDGKTPLGTQTLVDGVAAFATATLTIGSHTITAAYSGDSSFSAAVSTALTQIVASWVPLSAVPAPDGTTHLLWGDATGRADLRILASDGSTASDVTFGPYTGWQALALSVAPDNTNHILWRYTDGTISIWKIDEAGDLGSQSDTLYGPYTGWGPVGIATAADSSDHVLWKCTDNTMSTWRIDPSGSLTYRIFGPYPGWTPVAIATAPDPDLSDHVLWKYTDNTMSAWRIDPSGTMTYRIRGPYAGWAPVSIGVDSSFADHILWNYLDGTMSMWNVSATGALSYELYGPYAPWSAATVNIGPDDHENVLWTYPDGTLSVWNISSPGVFTYNIQAPPGD